MKRLIPLVLLIGILAGCKSVPIDTYEVPFHSKQTVILTVEKLAEVKTRFHQLCKAYGLRQPDPSEPASDSYDGIWYIYMASDVERPLTVFFERHGDHLFISVSGSPPGSHIRADFLAELVKILKEAVGAENVQYFADVASGLIGP